MEHDVFDAEIIEYERFGSTPVSSGEQLFFYRRLQDSYDKSLVAVINEDNQPIGYLERDVAMSRVLPGLKSGVRFQVTISGEPTNGRVPIQIRMIEQAEVSAILAKRTSRAERATLSPLAGIFAEDEEPEVEIEAEAEDEDAELDEDIYEDMDGIGGDGLDERSDVHSDTTADEDAEKEEEDE